MKTIPQLITENSTLEVGTLVQHLNNQQGEVVQLVTAKTIELETKRLSVDVDVKRASIELQQRSPTLEVQIESIDSEIQIDDLSL